MIIFSVIFSDVCEPECKKLVSDSQRLNESYKNNTFLVIFISQFWMCPYYLKGICFRPFFKPDSNGNIYGSLIEDPLLRFRVLTCINGVAAALPINNSLKAHFCTAPSTWHARYTGWHLRLVSPSSVGRGARLRRQRWRRRRQREAVSERPAPLPCEHEAGRNQRSPLPREPNAKTSDSGGPLGPAGFFFFLCCNPGLESFDSQDDIPKLRVAAHTLLWLCKPVGHC